MDTSSNRHFVFILLSVSNLFHRTVHGQERNENFTTESYTVKFTSPVPCTEPCENCTSWGECLQRCPPNTIYVENKETSEPTTTTAALTSDYLSFGFANNHFVKDSEGIHSQCQNCSLHIQHCHECHGNQTHHYCDKCEDGYSLSNERTCPVPSSSGVDDWVIAVAVVCSVLGLAAAAAVIIYLVHRNRRQTHYPPHIPDPQSV